MSVLPCVDLVSQIPFQPARWLPLLWHSRHRAPAFPDARSGAGLSSCCSFWGRLVLPRGCLLSSLSAAECLPRQALLADSAIS